MPSVNTVLARASTAGLLIALACGLTGASAAKPPDDGMYFPVVATQSETDEYTRYELLAPESGKFRITYEVTASTAGARTFYNPIRKGSVASDEAVIDSMTGKPLHFEVVSGADARNDPLMPDADPETDYIKVTLARPVPANGQGRLIILKTYEDRKSYYVDGRTFVFDRPLGIRRNKVVLPAGYEVVGLTVPSQIITEADGRIGISFVNGIEGEAPLVLRAAKGARTGAAAPRIATQRRSWESPFEGETEEDRLSERAHQDRDIVYFLQQPESHAFALYHDYTESRPGINGYANVVRKGSTASHPSAMILDTGERLSASEMSGAEMAALEINTGEMVEPDARVVVVPFTAVQPGQSLRIRIPATVSQLPDGRVRLDYWNGRPEPVAVLLKARRRVAP
jgi:hypothetical protein